MLEEKVEKSFHKHAYIVSKTVYKTLGLILFLCAMQEHYHCSKTYLKELHALP